jgi:hypothetical protein
MPIIPLGRIASQLRDDGENLRREPLPRHWVDLIHHLDEQERRRDERLEESARHHRSPAAVHEGPAELAVLRQEKLLSELLSTGEPTEQASALLKDMRRRVARALAERR